MLDVEGSILWSIYRLVLLDHVAWSCYFIMLRDLVDFATTRISCASVRARMDSGPISKHDQTHRMSRAHDRLKHPY